MRFEEILSDCIDAVAQGVTIEECLARYPMYREELHTLLPIAVSLQTAPKQRLSEQRFTQERMRLAAAAQLAQKRRLAHEATFASRVFRRQRDLGATIGHNGASAAQQEAKRPRQQAYPLRGSWRRSMQRGYRSIAVKNASVIPPRTKRSSIAWGAPLSYALLTLLILFGGLIFVQLNLVDKPATSSITTELLEPSLPAFETLPASEDAIKIKETPITTAISTIPVVTKITSTLSAVDMVEQPTATPILRATLAPPPTNTPTALRAAPQSTQILPTATPMPVFGQTIPLEIKTESDTNNQESHESPTEADDKPPTEGNGTSATNDDSADKQNTPLPEATDTTADEAELPTSGLDDGNLPPTANDRAQPEGEETVAATPAPMEVTPIAVTATEPIGEDEAPTAPAESATLPSEDAGAPLEAELEETATTISVTPRSTRTLAAATPIPEPIETVVVSTPAPDATEEASSPPERRPGSRRRPTATVTAEDAPPTSSTPEEAEESVGTSSATDSALIAGDDDADSAHTDNLLP